MTEQELKNMKLHNRIKIYFHKEVNGWVLRVVGGWIYYTITTHPYFETAVFVPEPPAEPYAGFDEWLASQPVEYPEPSDFEVK